MTVQPKEIDELAELLYEASEDSSSKKSWTLLEPSKKKVFQSMAGKVIRSGYSKKADDRISITRDEAAGICKRLEYDASWDKCGSGYYSLKNQLREADS